MGPTTSVTNAANAAGNPTRPRWSLVLRAVREARGVTLEGWGARLGVSQTTVKRWERGERAPDPGAESSLLAYCREAGLFRSYDRGPLAGLALTAELLQDLLAEARWRGRGAPVDATPSIEPPADGRLDSTPHGGTPPPPCFLPMHLTSFIGREREIAEVRRVQADTRLLTLTGAGGCGKSRLALALAGELLWAYPQGVWWVDLAPLPPVGSEGRSPQTYQNPALLPQAVASALKIRPTGQQSLTEALIDALRARQSLLVLDNCEHLLPACAELVETLLRACPHLEILATSRESLGIGGEAVWRVPPLSLPSRPEDVADADAVQLFVVRARLQWPDLTLTPETTAAVAQICRQLDGMPLAIELAAARVNVLSVGQIAERLADRFRLLTSGSRTALARHQTLRAALDWSYDLLAEPERVLLRALSVFAGGCTLEAAETVCAGMGADSNPAVVSATGVLDLLARLVDKSLVIADEHGGVVRYRLLETVRQYAAEQLTTAGEEYATRERHVAWGLSLAEAAFPHRTSPEQSVWLERLTEEHDNLRAALSWRLADEYGVAEGLRLGGLIWWFWRMRGHLSEGRRWLAGLLARDDHASPDVKARALEGAGMLAGEQRDSDEAVRLLEQNLALRRELGDEVLVGGALINLGVTFSQRGDRNRAQALFEESLALQRKLGDRSGIAACLSNLGIVAWSQGAPDRAVALYEEGLALMRELGDRWQIAGVLLNLGNAHRAQGAIDRAAACYRESLLLFGELGDRLGSARCLGGLAAVAALHGEAERAARLAGAAAALRAALGVPLPSAGDSGFEQATALARATLSAADFEAAWAAGQALSLEEATAEALAAPA